MIGNKLLFVSLLLVIVSLGCVSDQGADADTGAGLEDAEPTPEEQELANDLQELEDLQKDLNEVEDLGELELDTSVFE